MNTRYWTIYWLDGRKQHIVGDTITDAFNAAGIMSCAISIVDFYTPGLNQAYGWNIAEEKWIAATPATYINLLEMTVMGQRFLYFHVNSLKKEFQEKGIFFDHQNDFSCIVKTADLETIWNYKFPR
jgi:hypothetical protein